MRWNDRAGIIYNLKMVDEVYHLKDLDNTACDVLEYAKAKYPAAQIIFANGGDRTKENIPEMQVQGVDFVFGVGGDYKMNSSSWILEQWTHPKTKQYRFSTRGLGRRAAWPDLLTMLHAATSASLCVPTFFLQALHI